MIDFSKLVTAIILATLLAGTAPVAAASQPAETAQAADSQDTHSNQPNAWPELFRQKPGSSMIEPAIPLFLEKTRSKLSTLPVRRRS